MEMKEKQKSGKVALLSMCPVCQKPAINGELAEGLLKAGVSREDWESLNEAAKTGRLGLVFKAGLDIVRGAQVANMATVEASRAQVEIQKLLTSVTTNIEEVLPKLSEENRKNLQDVFQPTKELLDSQLTQIKEFQEKWAKSVEEIQRSLIRQANSPVAIGDSLQDEVARIVSSVVPTTDIVYVAGKGENDIDIVVEVKNADGKNLSKILLECKNTKDWKNNFVAQAEDYAKDYGIEQVIIATKTMPAAARNNRLDCFLGTNGNVWVIPLDAITYAVPTYRKMIVAQEEAEAKYQRKLDAVEKQSKLAKLLKEIVSLDDFQRIVELAQTIDAHNRAVSKAASAIQNATQKHANTIQDSCKEIGELTEQLLDQNGAIQDKIRRLDATEVQQTKTG